MVRVYVNVQSLIIAKEQSYPSSWIGGAEHINCYLTQELWRLKPPFSLSLLGMEDVFSMQLCTW